MPFLHVIRPGLQTTVQDLGRWGMQSRGVPVAGPMDPASHRVANALVGNPPTAATLEVALIGPELEFEDERTVAVAGAEFALTLDGRLMTSEATIHVRGGSRLAFGSRLFGARAYVAISGGIQSPKWLGSRATHLGSRMGGIDGRALIAGDRLPLGAARPQEEIPRVAGKAAVNAIRSLFWSRLRGEGIRLAARLRVLPGPQNDLFSEETFETLRSAGYAITSQSDRMGYRLDGPALLSAEDAEMISDATPVGALQVPPSGQPILLMADRQTTGGYPKIAVVITADIGVAGQLAPGDTVQFDVVSPSDALSALEAEERRLAALGARVA